jgi:hypothetical protein
MTEPIRLSAHAIYRPERIIKLLADSPLKNLGEEDCYRYLLHVHGIDRHQIKASGFQAIRISAHNKRVCLAWERDTSCKPFKSSPSPVPAGVVSRVPVEHGAPSAQAS